jgi:hypothetical protein
MNPRLWTAVVLLGILSLAAAAPAAAHSTKGRIKIPLEKVAPTIDDVAYFCESYVHRELYRHRFENNQRRFYVKEFVRIDREGPVATIHFLTLDVKEKRDFPDRMQIRRGADGVWTYTPAAGGEPVPLYTYVTKWGYYYQTYVLPVSAAGTVLAVALFGLLRFGQRRRRQAGKA